MKNDYGVKNKTKWALIKLAPLTESGLNEILATTRTKKEARLMAYMLGYLVTTRYSQYDIVRTSTLKADQS